MYLKNVLRFCAATTTLCCCAQSYAETITLGVANYPPFEFEDKNKNVVGIDADLVNAILKDIGYKDVKIKILPWSRVVQEMGQGVLDGTFTSNSDGVADKGFVYTKPISSAVTYYYKLASNKIPPFKKIDELKGKKIAIVQDYGLDDMTTDTIARKLLTPTQITSSTPEINLLGMLIKKRVDIVELDHVVAQWHIKNMAPKFDSIDYIESDLSYGPYTYSFAVSSFSKVIKDTNGFLKKFNDKLDEYWKNGKRKEILDKYGIRLPEVKTKN